MTRLRNWWWNLTVSKNKAFFQGYNKGLAAGRAAAYEAMNARLDSVLEEISAP